MGGDWCETVRLHFGRTLLVVGDVMGHGLESAVDMSAYRSSLRYIASADLPPHRVLRQMDDIASGEADRRPATCLLARVDPGRGQVTLASAGHLPPVLIGRDGAAGLLPVPVGPPLGTGLGGYESATHRVAPGETLVLFTDGLVERRGEDIDHSLARLAALRFHRRGRRRRRPGLDPRPPGRPARGGRRRHPRGPAAHPAGTGAGGGRAREVTRRHPRRPAWPEGSVSATGARSRARRTAGTLPV
ncbi:hypothetical protein GCM10017687_32410 [Streptomyces echinatus]|uniref:PP2C family protein-serine/threonine phosphatase n=1 Tax=Streptomyces echinatus TaxID=67293 RepID=UPI0031E73133